MQRLRHRLFAGTGAVLAAAAVTLATVSDVAASTGQPGAPGIGDELFPGLGNGGYDASHYLLKQRYPTSVAPARVDGVVRMDARATQDLSSLNLDFAGDAVASVRVNGRAAQFDWQRQAEELVITPSRAIKRGCAFSVEVTFTSHPVTPAPDELYPVGWVATQRGSFTSFQPDTAHNAIPVNDHPADKARWSFEIDVPRGTTAVTNGVSTGQRNTATRTVWTYAENSPLAAELIQIAVGDDLRIVERDEVAGVAYRDVMATARQDLFEPGFARGPMLLEWFVGKTGQFPSAIYGNLGVDLRFGYALETQGLALQSVGLYDPTFLPGRTGESWFTDSVQMHEISHEWYGNSVSPRRWADLWLNEGFATYTMKVWEEDSGTIDEWGNPSLEDYMREVYALGDVWRAEFGPVARPLSAEGLFSPQAYDGGALVLYALRQKVGAQTFDAIYSGWPRQHRDMSVGTSDFIEYASRTAGQDLSGFLGEWLYGDRTPEMPGHDWTVDPMTDAAAATAGAGLPSGPHGWTHAHSSADGPIIFGAK